MSVERADELVSMVVDGDAAAPVWEAWEELTLLADRDPAIWRRLACTQRDHAALMRAVGHVSRVAEGIEAPVEAIGSRRRRRFVGAWAGWAAAAMLGIVLVSGRGLLPSPSTTGGTAGAGAIPISTEDAFRRYLERGRAEQIVVDELPDRVLIDARELPHGEGYELLYLRQVIERRTVPALYEIGGRDEAGRPSLVRYEQPVGPPM